MTEKRKYDSTVARIAGNIAGGMMDPDSPMMNPQAIACNAVMLARLIVAETERTEPVSPLPEVKK